MQSLETLTRALRGRIISVDQKSAQPATNKPDKGFGRWTLYKQLCIAKSDFNLNDRCLAVLSALLSFLPADELSERIGLVVFPSNHQLSLRAHGMPESTLRRHLASLVDAGIIERKDSPTRKRYAHKKDDGNIDLAFGFSFLPLLQRAQDIGRAAEKILAATKLLKKLRDEVSVIRRDVAEQFTAILPQTTEEAELNALFRRFRLVVDRIPRRASHEELFKIKAQLSAIQQELVNYFKNINNVEELSASDAQNERHHNESLSESIFEETEFKDLKNDCSKAKPAPSIQSTLSKRATLSLEMVLKSCPDIQAYAAKGILCWRDLLDASRVVSSFLGIADTAYRDATSIMGREGVSAIIAWILQRSHEIRSPGGYLRSLTQKARIETFSLAALFQASLP